MRRVVVLAASFALAAASGVPALAQMAQANRQEQNVQENPWRNLVDSKRAEAVAVVLRVRLLQREGGDKIGWDRVRLIGVIKNSSHFTFPSEFEIAHYSGEPGVPDGESTVYLERYNAASESLWRLLGGSGKAGVSHGSTDAGPR
jgi:hypothetical protein